MNKTTLIRTLTESGIPYRPGGQEHEIALRCPQCSSRHPGNRLTLYVNTAKEKWICFRCDPRRAGVGPGSLLDQLRLPHLKDRFDADNIPADSLAELRRKLLGLGSEPEPVVAVAQRMPEGFRRDWNSTIMGAAIYNYLRKRNLSDQAIKDCGVGYTVKGPVAGCAVFPVYNNGDLKLWQARRVLLGTEPKYISPAGAEKHAALYNYDRVEPAAVILVEGIFDALAVAALNVSVAALLGKSISDAQIALLAAKRVQRVIVLLDSDAPAAAKDLCVRLEAKLWTVRRVNRVTLPAGLDPSTVPLRDLESLIF